ncbi:MAG: dihydrolipoyl dehydrogenase [Chloroflexi bacterium]|nr:dihydrolipoyl dehydrogenase [Chloroflexota bacterium]|tara:strand:+ start:17492 stop:18940 length:1449 start_codon:yes stop_codon:yes gene_type:complete
MKKINIDVAIIGGGTAGLSAYREAKKNKKHVKLIEGGVFGTTCARVGCMPSKLLIAAAENVHSTTKSKEFGINVENVSVDRKAVMDRVKFERDRFVGFVLESIDNMPEKDKILGKAKFKNNNTLIVDDLEIEASTIVIATGSRPAYPKIWEELGNKLIINDDVFEWETLPKSVAVFGAGVIGMELGQALHRLGVNVKLFSIGGAVGALTDQEIKDYTTKTLNKEFYFDPNAEVLSVNRNNDNVIVEYIDKETKEKVVEEFEYLLAATGRRPNVDNLDIENTTIELDERGIPVANKFTMQTSVENIFIAGDASNQLPLLHEAADQGLIAGYNAGIYPQINSGLRRTPISVVFSDPQIGMVGETKKELELKYGKCGCYEVGQVSFENQGRSRVMLKNQGLMNIYGENGTGLLLGAEFISPDAEHLAHLLSWAIQKKLTVREILDLPFYHPVIEEGVRTALRDLSDKLKLGTDIVEDCLNCGLGC